MEFVKFFDFAGAGVEPSARGGAMSIFNRGQVLIVRPCDPSAMEIIRHPVFVLDSLTEQRCANIEGRGAPATLVVTAGLRLRWNADRLTPRQAGALSLADGTVRASVDAVADLFSAPLFCVPADGTAACVYIAPETAEWPYTAWHTKDPLLAARNVIAIADQTGQIYRPFFEHEARCLQEIGRLQDLAVVV